MSRYFDIVPWIPLRVLIRGPMLFIVNISFVVLGFTFLIPNRVALSLWLLNLISWGTRYYILKYGLEMQEHSSIYGAANHPITAHIGVGAMMIFVLASLWVSRQHLRRVLRCALGVGDRSYDTEEPCSYRTALVLLVVTLIVMLVWLRAAGLGVAHGALFLAVAMAIFYGLTRLVAQCGVSVAITPMIAPGVVTSAVGGANITARGLGAITMSWVWCSDIRTTVMSSAAHGMYLARRKARGLLWTMMLAVALTAVTSTLYTIYLGYHSGALNLSGWAFMNGPKQVFKWGLYEIEYGAGPNPEALFWTGVGAAVMAGLVLAQRTLFWWPIHPVGFIICSVIWTDWLWFTIMLAWLIKIVVVRLGGNRMYRAARRVFLGMILGQITVAGVFAVVDTCAQKFGNLIFWF